ncbi:uncharacterized protein EKO05_0001808 [Ascochyta rabiei]|uniref:uncharacterized protein n=1 Tax=Didymella rabiei TaxID=5454 RepID=UPI00220ACF30|nr:uncharacterized protein EKO05_0001808 [Ascochyta rabiei]UPX11186.1 hypothetical protein EKO05_0001808 [Ascochyta rabiei]
MWRAQGQLTEAWHAARRFRQPREPQPSHLSHLPASTSPPTFTTTRKDCADAHVLLARDTQNKQQRLMMLLDGYKTSQATQAPCADAAPPPAQ